MTNLTPSHEIAAEKGKTYFYVYILQCNNNSYYTGYTTNLERRYQEHVKGTIKCKFTRSFKPLYIAQSWKIYGNKNIAMKIEKYIKSLNREKKEHLIQFPDKLLVDYPSANISRPHF
jgi:putative endonuclease